MVVSDLSEITEDVVELVNECGIIVYSVEISENKKFLLISTNLLDCRNDLIDLLLWIIGDDIYISDDFLIHNEFSTFIDRNTVLTNIHKLTIGLPITQYFCFDNFFGVSGTQLVCKTNKFDLKNHLMYFCQAVLKHLDFISAYNNFLQIIP